MGREGRIQGEDNKMQKLKRLKPSMREKKRYVVIALKSSMTRKEAYKLVDSALLEGLGTLGYAKASITFIQFDSVKGKAIIRTNPKQLANVKSALILAGLACIGVSGTIKRAREKFL